jgi:acetate kinase
LRAKTARLISAAGSRVAVAVVPTDEELEIAQQTYSLVEQ